MKKVLMLSVGLLTSLFIIGCPSTDPSMYCETMGDAEQCIDGSWPQACVSYDGTQCAYNVMGRYYYCTGCDYCDDATMAAVSACYGYYYSTEDMGITAQEQVVDESIIQIKADEFKDAIALLKETNQ